MIRSLQNSAAGINAQQARLDTTAGNLSGVNADGFKGQKTSFVDLLYSKLSESGKPVLPQADRPDIGSGSREILTVRLFDQGDIRETGRETDLAISGKGFFKITLPDGSQAFTRTGIFKIDAERALVTEDGYRIYPEIILPEGSQELLVGRDGQVRVRDAGGNINDLGELTLSNFVNPGGLEFIGKNLFAATEISGPEEEGAPGQGGFGEIIQKSLESSNVDITAEMTSMLESQRNYQLNARALRMTDEMWGLANNLRK